MCGPTCCLIDFKITSTLHLFFSSVPFVSNFINGALISPSKVLVNNFLNCILRMVDVFFENGSTFSDDAIYTIAEMDNPNGTEGGYSILGSN